MNVLITGATDGIGLELARLYRARGARVIAVGRRPASQLEPWLCERYCRVELALPYAASLVAAWMRRHGIDRLDLLIHCAGIGAYGPPEQQEPAEIDHILAVNLRAPIALTRAMLPALEAARGRIVFIGSVAAALPAPEYAVYGATKAALEGFARNLRVELRGMVDVQVIHPGATRTGMHMKAGAPLERIGWRRFPPPEQVARKIVAAIDRGRAIATIGAINRALRLAGRHAPRLVDYLARMRQNAYRAAPHTLPNPSTPRHCVVTGGADGIGRALVERYARAGYAVTIIDRDREQSERLCRAIQESGGAARWIVADLAQPAALAATLRQLTELPPIDILVHSAGISAVGHFTGSDIAAQQRVLDVNLAAPLQLTAGLLRAEQFAPDGTMVFIASLSVFTSYPGAAVYAASKDGIAAYARSVRAAAHRRLHALTVFPGPTRTAHARRYSPDNRREQRRMPPEQLAGHIAAAIERHDTTMIPGIGNRLFAAVGRLAPGVTEWLMRMMILNQLPRSAHITDG